MRTSREVPIENTYGLPADTGHARHRRTAIISPDHAVSPPIGNLALVLENNAVYRHYCSRLRYRARMAWRVC